MEIAESARKHGVSDEDIHHATRNPLVSVLLHDDRVLLIGADHGGQLLEIIVLDPDGDPVAIHADTLRPKFFRYL